jgi:hypothetical protein
MGHVMSQGLDVANAVRDTSYLDRDPAPGTTA